MISGQRIKQYLRKSLPALYSLYGRYQNGRIVKNFFKTSFSKNVLICYITDPFRQGATLSHTNMAESLQIAEAFQALGYNCDIMNHDSGRKASYDKYDIIFGFGEVFKKSFYFSGKDIKRIYYGTGKHPYFSNAATIKRGLEVKAKKGRFLIESLRLVREDYLLQTTAVDALMIVGGEKEAATYRKYTNLPIYNIDVSFFKVQDPAEIVKGKDFSQAKKHFLFFSGGGLIHKGLDLLLEAFAKADDLHLHICASIDAESRFQEAYRHELYDNERIHTYGFISVESETFKKLLHECAFVILPSCSEGKPTSVINAVGNGGLIPMLTDAASIDLEALTIPISGLSVTAITQSLNRAQSFTDDELREMSAQIGELVSQECTIENYGRNMQANLQKIISSYKN